MQKSLQWWQDVYSFLDVHDIEWDRNADFNRFEAHIRDLIVDRPLEWSVFKRLFTDAWNRQYTPAQKNAVDLHAYAVRIGHPSPIQYVADQRDTCYSAARKLLHRAKQRKMSHFDSVDHVIYDSVDNWQPPRADVKAILAKKQVICAGSGENCEGHAQWRYGLCWPCRLQFGAPGQRSELTERWLIPEIRRIRNQAYHEVVNELIAKHRIGQRVNSTGEYDALANAG